MSKLTIPDDLDGDGDVSISIHEVLLGELREIFCYLTQQLVTYI